MDLLGWVVNPCWIMVKWIMFHLIQLVICIILLMGMGYQGYNYVARNWNNWLPSIVSFMDYRDNEYKYSDIQAIKESFMELNKYADTDYTPLLKFKDHVWILEKEMNNYSYNIKYATSKISKMDDKWNNYIMDLFDNIDRMMNELNTLSENSIQFYYDQQNKMDEYIYSINVMKKYVKENNYKGINIKLMEFIDGIDNTLKEVKRIKENYIEIDKHARQHYKQSVNIGRDMKIMGSNQNDHNYKQWGFGSFITGSTLLLPIFGNIVNPLISFSMIIGGGIGIYEGIKLDTQLYKDKMGYDFVSTQFNHTSNGLNQTIKGIDMIIRNLINVKSNLMNTNLFIQKMQRLNMNEPEYEPGYRNFEAVFGFLSKDQKELMQYLNELEYKWVNIKKLCYLNQSRKKLN